MRRALPSLTISLLLLSIQLSTPARAGDGWVALTTADPSCPDASGDFYVDCVNGTITDNRTGLVWLKNADCFGGTTWADAMLTTAGLSSGRCGLTDGSSPGDWRLPSKEEWEAMIADAVGMGCSPFLTNDDGTLCWADDPAASVDNLVAEFYYSANTSESFPDLVWFVNMVNGFIGPDEGKAGSSHFWPVRGGQ